MMAANASDHMAEEGAGGFHLYTLPGKATIQPGSTTTIALFDPATTAYEKRLVVRGQLPWYGFVPQQQDEQTVPVEMTYILKRPAQDALRRQAAARWHRADLQPGQRRPAAAGGRGFVRPQRPG